MIEGTIGSAAIGSSSLYTDFKRHNVVSVLLSLALHVMPEMLYSDNIRMKGTNLEVA